VSSGATISRAIGGVRCGRNLTTVGYAVVGRDFTEADESTFDVLLQRAADKLSAIPR
jgi:hypothetical protein